MMLDSVQRQQRLEEFRDWVLKQESGEYRMYRAGTENQKIVLETDYCRGEVAFYPQEIVELCVINKSNDQHVFYLHFQMGDIEYARERFGEMLETVRSMVTKPPVKIMLSCSCGITTYYFADKLNQTARLLDLDYEFAAVSYTRLYEEGGQYDAIFLAPQVAYMQDSIQKTLPQIRVAAIPAKLFAAYDVRQFYELVENTLQKDRISETFPRMAPLDINYQLNCKILTIAIIREGKKKFRMAVRLYGKGSKILYDRDVIKKRFTADDLGDICDTAFARNLDIEAVSIAMPGIINEEGVTIPAFEMDHTDLAGILFEKYQKPVFIENDANCIALGYYNYQKEFQSISVLYQPVIGQMGGMGSIHEGRLIKGLHNVAGEIKFMPVLQDSMLNPLWGTPEGVQQIAAHYLTSVISILGPELIVLIGRLFCDTERFREELLKYIPENYLPEIHHICEVREHMLWGAMINCSRALEDTAWRGKADGQ